MDSFWFISLSFHLFVAATRGDRGSFNLSLLDLVLSVFQSPEPRTVTNRGLSTIPPVPTIRITPPPIVHPYDVTRESHCAAPRIRNLQGRFTRASTATLHPAVFTPEGSPDGTLDSLPTSSSGSSVSSLSSSDSPFINDTPATSPAPQQVPTLPPPVQPVMADSKGSLQWEGGADDNPSPGQFLREIDNKIDECSYTTERQKVNCMRNNIAFGSAADEWFGNLVLWIRRILYVQVF
jgi:hypothetical protein